MSNVRHGMIVREQSGFYWVEVPSEANKVYRCRLRGKLMEVAHTADIAAIGDQVDLLISENEDLDHIGTIIHVYERQHVLSRSVRTSGLRGGGSPERQQVIIANADQALFVFAIAQPTPDYMMLDRLLVTGERAQIPNLTIVVNKVDLVSRSEAEALFAPYMRMGYPIIFTSTVQDEGIETLQTTLKDAISVFTGPSGVGKTSLLNRIQPGLGRAVKAVSQSSQEGMHTTRDSVLVRLENGGYIADTPGIRQLAIWDMEPEELDGYFLDIAELVPNCQFNRSCKHYKEPGCAVREAVLAGQVDKRRYKHYLVMRKELEEQLVAAYD